MKKILLVVPSLSIGGQEKAAIDTAELLKDLYDVKLVVFHRHDIEYDTDCKKIYLDVGAHKTRIGKVFGQIKRVFKLASIRRKEKPDIVYSFGETANLTNALSGGNVKGKTIIAIHGFASVYKSVLNKIVFKNSDRIICISKAMQDALIKIYPMLCDKTVVVENGYDIETIKTRAQEEALPQYGSVKFVAMGRLEEVKGYTRLLHAFAGVLSEIPDATLRFVGKGTLESDLKSLCTKLNLENNVEFVGYQKNPYAWLAQSDVFVLSSLSEGFPNAIIESMACGLSCLCVDCQTGPREILSELYSSASIKGVVEEKYGVLVEQSNNDNVVIENLKIAMIMLGLNKEKISKYQAFSKERCCDFSIEKLREKLCTLFDNFECVRR